MINDSGAPQVRMLIELHARFLDDERRKVDLEVQNHVVHPQRVRVALDVQPDRLLIYHDTSQHETVVGFSKGAHLVATSVNADVVRIRG
jgi:hypothetical protein